MPESSRCQLDPTCELGPHRREDHPCGQRTERSGEPCRHCGEPVPGPEMNGGACPDCWTPATLANTKGLFAPHGLSVDTDGHIRRLDGDTEETGA